VRYGIADTLDLVRGIVRDLAGCAEFVVLDMGPSDEASALAGLVATDELLIPTRTDYTSVTRLAPVLGEVRVARQVQPGLNVLGIVPVMTGYYFGRLRQSKSTLIGKFRLAGLPWIAPERRTAEALRRVARGTA
jgi:cellulose biosynthesis protein BcsQ